MTSSRPRSRAIALLAALLIVGSVGVAPAAGGIRKPVDTRPSVAPNHPGQSTGRPEPAERRGHVRVDRLPTVADGLGTQAPEQQGDALQPQDDVGVAAGPAVDHATTSTTTAPTLAKLPVTTGTSQNPNPVVAAGPDHVAWSDNGFLTIANRTGGAAETVSFADFFLLPDDATNGQGQIYYDAAHGRWIAVEVSGDCVPGNGATYGHGYLDFAVSDTANPRLGWELYGYVYDDTLTYDPGYGSSADQIVLTSRFEPMGDSNCASGGMFSHDVTGITWSDLFGGTFDESYFVFEPNDEDFVLSMQPVVRVAGAETRLDVIVDFSIIDPAGQEQWLLKIDGAGQAADATLSELPVPVYGAPGLILQQGASLYPTGGPTGAVAANDRLVFSLTELCTPPGDSAQQNCARVVELDTGPSVPVRVQDFYISQKDRHTFSPGVTIAGNGDLVVTYQKATEVAGPTAYVVRQTLADDLNSISPARTLVNPTNVYQNLGGAEAIGLAPDPIDPQAAWVINQAGGTVDPDPYAYRLQVAQAQTATGDTYVPIPPVRILDTRLGTGLSGVFQNSLPRSFNVAGAGGGAIPADAVAITANLTVVDQQAAGYVSVGPSISANPATSTINFPSGDTRANNLTLPLNADGDLQAVYKGPPGKFTHLLLDVTGYFTADDAGATYQPITAVRKLDTRTGTGLSGKFNANTPRSFQVTGGTVPTDAVAVTGNLTVVGQSKAGYVSLTPNQQANPATSTINFPLGDTRANGVTVPLSGTGKLWAVFKASGGSTDLIFDVTGYYLEGTSGLRFYPLNPGRIMDTRFNTLTQLFGQFTSSTPRTLVTGGHFGVPANALALTGNLTVVGQTKAGYVSITKDPTANPAVSTLNFPLGDVRANGATVPLNASNDLALVYKATTGAKTHLILDVTGYFR